MRNHNKLKLFLTLLPLVLYGAFFLWYTNLSGPLTEKEIAAISAKMRAANADKDMVALMEKFIKEDTGREFFMVNVSELRDKPLRVGTAREGESSTETRNRYGRFMLPRLLSRACHPIFIGPAKIRGLAALGGENLRGWTDTAIVRYRSRRDFIMIVGDPAFNSKHKYKMAALKRTLAFPVEPRINMAGPRLMGLLLTIILVLLVRIFMR